MSYPERADLERCFAAADLPGRFCIITMGCQMNVYDSHRLAQTLLAAGLSSVETPEEADLVLINTCTVRAKPEEKAYSLVGRLGRLKRKSPGLVLGIIGCLAQQEGARLLDRFPQLDLVMGPRDSAGLIGALEAILGQGERVVATRLKSRPHEPAFREEYFQGKATAYVSIMEGCNNHCTYCIVPHVRGREVSRDPGLIVQEAEGLIRQGVKEITLLGQNVNAYLWEGKGTLNFSGLLRVVSELEGLFRLRFTTSHPKSLSPELIDCFAELNNLCPHIHLPFQAGANGVLRRMGRGYTREQYMDLVARLRETRPEIAISSDVMVGFPGESDVQFEETLDLVTRVGFDGLFSFKYSDRRGTVAETMIPKVPEAEKAARLTRLQSLQKTITLKKNKALEGSVVEVLVEGPGKRKGQVSGRTESNKIVNFNNYNNKLVNIVNVVIKEGLLNSLRGELATGT